MKKILHTLVFLLFASQALAASYYVSNSGSNTSGDGSRGTPWETGTYALSRISDGDTVFFERGGEWHETLTIPYDNVTLDAYGTGNKPVLNGSQPLSGWSSFRGNIYSTILEKRIYQLFEDSQPSMVAHTPNGTSSSGYFRADASSGSRWTIFDTPEGISDPVGATLMVRPEAWHWLSYRVQSYSGGTIILVDDGRPNSDDTHVDQNEPYYLCNKLAFMDTGTDSAGQWYSNGYTVFYWATDGADPDTHLIEATTERRAVFAREKDNLTIRNLEIKHYGHLGIHLLDCVSATIDNCTISLVGSHIYDPIGTTSKGATNYGIMIDGRSGRGPAGTISNNVLSDILGAGIYAYMADGLITSGNTVTRIGMFGSDQKAPWCGLGGIDYNRSSGTIGGSRTADKNTVTHTGYNGIKFSNKPVSVQNNTVQHTMQHLNDGGGIYCSGTTIDGSLIDHNIVEDTGPDHTVQRAINAIYLDNASDKVTVTNNIVRRASRGILLHSARDCTVTDNQFHEVFNGVLMNSDWSADHLDNAEPQYAGGNTFVRNEINCLDLGGRVVYMADYHADTASGQDFGLAAAMDDNTYWPDRDGSFYLLKGEDGTVYKKSWSTDLDGWRTITAAQLTGGELDSHSNMGTEIPKENWSLIYVDSEELVGEDGSATNAFDNDPATMWHTQWLGSPDPAHPHEIIIDLGRAYDLYGFSYTPYQVNGRIIDYELFVAANSYGPWATPVAAGAFADDASVKSVSFSTTPGRYIRLVAYSEPNGNPWTSAAEIGLRGDPVNTPPNGVIDTPAGHQTIRKGESVYFSGTGTDPDNDLPLSYLWRFGADSGIDDYTLDDDPGDVVFDHAGTFTVTLTVTDAQGASDPTPDTRVITVTDTDSPPISKTDWTLVYVDSEELIAEDGAAVNAFDDDPGTMWHTQWQGDPDPAHPHEIIIDLGDTYDVDGFSYTPYQVNGRIIDYEFFVSAGSNGPWNTPAAAGTFANDASVKTVSFPKTSGRYIRLAAYSEPNGNPWTSAAEIGVTGIRLISYRIPKTDWTLVYVDSEERTAEDGAAVNAFDDDPGTMWHTQWQGDPDPAHPHEIIIDLGAIYNLDGLIYLPYQVNGRIIDYEFFVSAGSSGPWTTPVAAGALANDATEKSVSFQITTGRYIRLVAHSEPNGNPWTSAAEIGVIGK